MKAYRLIDTFFAPGTQPKGAEKIDVPTDTNGLVAFLNDLVADIRADAGVGDLMRTRAILEQAKVEPQVTPFIDAVLKERQDLKPVVQAVAYQAPAKITDEAFEALPVDHQLHLAALAVENARTRRTAR